MCFTALVQLEGGVALFNTFNAPELRVSCLGTVMSLFSSVYCDNHDWNLRQKGNLHQVPSCDELVKRSTSRALKVLMRSYEKYKQIRKEISFIYLSEIDTSQCIN